MSQATLGGATLRARGFEFTLPVVHVLEALHVVEGEPTPRRLTPTEKVMAHTLPALPYDFAALEPYIDAQTMQIHHGKHHQAYVNNLNAALDKHAELHKKTLEELLRGINTIPDDIRTAVRNNGGGHHNHSLFWTIMAPAGKGGGGEPAGALADAIKKTFGD